MDYLPIIELDEELIKVATDMIRKNYVEGKHGVGSAIRTKSGRIFAGVNLESAVIGVCAEPIAIGIAISNGEREFDSIVAVTLDNKKEPIVLSPCGNCREIIKFYGSDIAVIFVEDGMLKKCRVSDLLPGPYIY